MKSNSPFDLHAAAKRFTGIIKRFNNTRGTGGGYGFIGSNDIRGDVFVHARAVRGASESDRALYPGDEVSFELGEHNGRECAKNVIVQLRAAEPPLDRLHD